MDKIIRYSIYFLGLTFFAIYFARFVEYTARILAFWPVMLANETGHFILTKDILTYGIANLVWIMIFPAFVVSLFEYTNQKTKEIDWKTTPEKPKKEFVSVMEQVKQHNCCNHSIGTNMVQADIDMTGATVLEPTKMKKITVNADKVVIKSKKKNKKSKNK